MVALWRHRNNIVFSEEHKDLNTCKKMVYDQVALTAGLSKSYVHDSYLDNVVARAWNVKTRLRKEPRLKECKWLLPDEDMVKANSDGAAKGNPGQAGAGTVFRDHTVVVLLVISKGLGITTNFMAECEAVMICVEIALERGWHQLWVESDSRAAVLAFVSGKIP
ncbi:hypothetical protein FRX31_020352 [Thalictrum thalictroides]|uniref:RNase H type-1 domain-containing protein n=1 Tax=Thalictrum thalictroides TaxID=46969 RepID=A0A7J6VY44_THATH|nr:hypothetical protein FRX31_020352 [Thalictrum thalictroides]